MVVWPRSVIVDLNICLLFILHCSYKYIVSLDDMPRQRCELALRWGRISELTGGLERSPRRCDPSAPESAHQQRGGSPRRTEHWLSVAEGNCVAERRGGKQPEANNQSIIKKMMNSIRPDALASLLGKGEAQNGS
jgi:hypothetical protein